MRNTLESVKLTSFVKKKYMGQIYYSKFARDHYLGRYYIFRHELKMAWHVFGDMFIS